jgi:hypothetical protein
MKRMAATVATLAMALCLLPAIASAAGPPTIEYSTPSPIRNESATLRFSVNPEGLETKYEVNVAEVGASYNHWLGPGFPIFGEGPVAQEVGVPRYPEVEMRPGTEYHWQVTAFNEDGETVGAEQFFTTTDGPAPAFDTVAAVQTAPEQVSLSGTVDPEGVALTGCRFRLITKSVATYAGFEKSSGTQMVRFGKTVPCDESVQEIGSGSEPVPVEAVATGLEPGEYDFRIEGENAFEAPDAGAVGHGVRFTVSPDFVAPELPGPTPPPAPTSPPAPEAGGSSPAPPPSPIGKKKHVSCPRAHRGKTKGKKHRGAKRGKRAKACRRQ